MVRVLRNSITLFVTFIYSWHSAINWELWMMEVYSQVGRTGLLLSICLITLFPVLERIGSLLRYFEVRGENCTGGLKQRWIREYQQYRYIIYTWDNNSAVEIWALLDQLIVNPATARGLTKHKCQLSYTWKQNHCCGLQNTEFNVHPYTMSQIWACYSLADEDSTLWEKQQVSQ
jgi:hypothetical protein